MKKIFLLLILIFHVQNSIAQNPLVKQWDFRFGGTKSDEISSFQQTSDGGYILGGYSKSGINGNKTQSNCDTSGNTFDYWIVKIDSAGIKQWDKDFGGNATDVLTSIQQTSDGGYILGGWSLSGASGDKSQPSWGLRDYWIVKTDSVGNKQWDKDFGGLDDDYLNSVRQSFDGGYILGGYSFSNIGGDKTQSLWGQTDYWIVKVDSSGNKQWDKDFGGTNWDYLHSIEQTNEGGYLIGGYAYSGISGNKSENSWGGCDYWIIKIDSVGNMLWDKDFGGTHDDYLYSLHQTMELGYILGGCSYSVANGNKTQPNWDIFGLSSDYWIVKLDSVGNMLWDKDFGGTDDETDFGNITQTDDSGYLLAGSSVSPISGDKTESNLGYKQNWILKTDSIGQKQWDKTVKTNSFLYDDQRSLAVQTLNCGYAVVNYTTASIGGEKTDNNWDTTNLTYDFWIIKYLDSTCIPPSQISFTSSDTIFCGKQFIDFFDHSTNNPTTWQWYFPGGAPASSTQQNPMGIFYNSYGTFDITLIACNANGCDTLFLPNFINELPSPPVPIVTWVVDTLFSTVAYSYQWYFNSASIPGATNSFYVFQQPGNYFVIVTDSNGCATASNNIYTGIDELSVDNANIYVIPNPSDGNFILYGAAINSTLKIYDVEGRIVFSGKINSSAENLNLKIGDGIYFLEIGAKENLIRKKIVLKN